MGDEPADDNPRCEEGLRLPSCRRRRLSMRSLNTTALPEATSTGIGLTTCLPEHG
jgi:hypothetical protein